MKYRCLGMVFEVSDDENSKVALRQFAKYYTELSHILKKSNCDYFYMPLIPTQTKEYAISPIITKDIVVLRVTDKDGNLYSSCRFDTIKDTSSDIQELLFTNIKEHKSQPKYSRKLIDDWMSELAKYNKENFADNREVYNKYERVRRGLEKAYGIVPSTKDIKNVDTQKTVSPSDQEIRAAAFIRDNRAKADKMGVMDRELENPRSLLNDILTTNYNQTRTDLSKAIYEYAIQENISGTPEDTVKETVEELFRGTGCDPEPYLRKAEKVYSEDIRDIKDIKEQKSSIKLF